jgi:hypothetical protein
MEGHHANRGHQHRFRGQGFGQPRFSMQDTQGFKEKAMSHRYPYPPDSQNVCIRILRKMAYTPAITWSPLVLSFVIAMWTPSNIFELFPFLKRYVEFVVFLVPSVQGNVNHSLFPANTALLLSYSWTLVLFYIPIFSIGVLDNVRRFKFSVYFRGVLCATPFVFFIYLFEGSEGARCYRLCINSRLFDQFILFGVVYPVCFACGFACYMGFAKKVFYKLAR